MASSCPDAATRPHHTPKPHPHPHARTSTVGGSRAKINRQPRRAQPAPIGERTPRIEGSFRRITVHQLTLAWWLHRSGYITRRQLRVYFAAHELREQRRYTSPEHRGAMPLYTMGQIAKLVGSGGAHGGRGDQRALRELRGDLKALARLGLVLVTKHAIEFAVSADQIRLGGHGGHEGSGGCGGRGGRGGAGEPADLAGFWAMFNAMPNRQRSVPVPRRLLRALAGGFSKGGAALAVAFLIRGLFWHKGSEGSTGDYRTDGRYKLSWVAKHFGISRRAATEARSRLIEQGWLEPLDVNQWEMNRWGLRDRLITEGPQARTDTGAPAAVGGRAGSGARDQRSEGDIGSASPNSDFDAGSATPDQTDSLSLTGDLKTRKLPPRQAGRERSGVSTSSTFGKGRGDRKKRAGGAGGSARDRGRARAGTKNGAPNIRDIRSADLADTGRLLELHRQAVKLGIAKPTEAGRLDFLSLAERARRHGRRAGALMFYLLRERKTAFITQAAEDEASRRLKEHLFGVEQRRVSQDDDDSAQQWGSGGGVSHRSVSSQAEHTEDDQIVLACLRVGQKHRVEPFRIARQTKGWSLEEWNRAKLGYEGRRWERVAGQIQAEQD